MIDSQCGVALGGQPGGGDGESLAALKYINWNCWPCHESYGVCVCVQAMAAAAAGPLGAAAGTASCPAARPRAARPSSWRVAAGEVGTKSYCE